MKIPEEKLPEIVSKLKAANPGRELRLLTANADEEDFEVIVVSPDEAEFQEFKDAIADEAKSSRANPMLTRACVVYPPAADLDLLLQRKPGLGTSFGLKLQELAGAVKEVQAKKL